MDRRLVSRPRIAVWTIVGCAVVVAALGIKLHDDTRGNRFDDAVVRWIGELPSSLVARALDITDPAFVIGVLAVIAFVATAARRWDVAALTVLAPTTSITLTELVLKPVVHRVSTIHLGATTMSNSLAYPSGHETGLASLLAVGSVVLALTRLPTAYKVSADVVLALVAVVGAIGLVGGYFHYATDTIGAIALVGAVTLGYALAIDGIGAAISARSRARAPVGELR